MIKCIRGDNENLFGNFQLFFYFDVVILQVIPIEKHLKKNVLTRELHFKENRIILLCFSSSWRTVLLFYY